MAASSIAIQAVRDALATAEARASEEAKAAAKCLVNGWHSEFAFAMAEGLRYQELAYRLVLRLNEMEED